jgi:hypothetical protein
MSAGIGRTLGLLRAPMNAPPPPPHSTHLARAAAELRVLGRRITLRKAADAHTLAWLDHSALVLLRERRALEAELSKYRPVSRHCSQFRWGEGRKGGGGRGVSGAPGLGCGLLGPKFSESVGVAGRDGLKRRTNIAKGWGGPRKCGAQARMCLKTCRQVQHGPRMGSGWFQPTILSNGCQLKWLMVIHRRHALPPLVSKALLRRAGWRARPRATPSPRTRPAPAENLAATPRKPACRWPSSMTSAAARAPIGSFRVSGPAKLSQTQPNRAAKTALDSPSFAARVHVLSRFGVRAAKK